MLKEKVSIIIPVFNEVEILPLLVKRLQSALDTLSCDYELIFIDDHSRDGSYEILHGMSSPNLIVTRKVGKKGKAFSLMQGFQQATGTIVGMIDADLQYAPEDIPAMVDLLKEHDVVVANRKRYNDNLIRRSLSRTYKTLFGKGLFNLSVDIQSGLKVFRKEVIDVVAFTPRSGWTFDLEFLNRTRHAGFSIKGHDITFNPRSNSKSKINLVGSTLEIGANALRVRSKRIYPMHSAPQSGSMLGAGVHFKKKKYVTHTTLPHTFSALRTFEKKQQLFFFSLVALVISGLALNPFMTGLIIVALLSTLYFIDTLFNLFVVLKSLSSETEISSTEDELRSVDESTLPVYTILCPLYKESHIIPHFLDAISKLDWPKVKLDVMLLLEEDDTESVEAVKLMNLPSYVRVIVVPDSQPKTKPKACNYGLSFAKGEYLVIYDAEDIPDTQQLKKAYLAFKKVPKNVVCLQAKLNYFNPHQNLLTRFFTAEYSLWFDVSLTGLQSIGSIMPLGGTSNHFKTKDLHMLQGWDPFNVTEDADLGMRLFKKGYRTAMIDSVTLEEANSNTKNWIRQRSRWIKGYMQTYLVHLRDIVTFTRQRGRHSLVFHLVLGGKLAFILINPILWITTISYFTLYAIVGETIESLFPSWVFYMAGFSLVFGNFLFLYYYMIGCLKRGHYSLIKYVYLVPLYWLLISVSGFMAFYQLLFKPHYWEKTVHGLHLAKLPTIVKLQKNYAGSKINATPSNPGLETVPESYEVKKRKVVLIGGILVVATVFANFLNFAFNASLYRVIDLEDFALLSLFGSLFSVAQIPFSALSATVSYHTGFSIGKNSNREHSITLWKFLRRKALLISTVFLIGTLLSLPLLTSFFHTKDSILFILFGLVWFVGFIGAVDKGYLLGSLMLGSMALLVLLEPVIKFGSAYLLLVLNNHHYTYSSIPLSLTIVAILGWFIIKRQSFVASGKKGHIKFSTGFFFAALLSGLSTMSFISLDVILAKHYLTVDDAGRYALLSLLGKMIFFIGSLANQFVIPLVGQNEGKNKKSEKTFYFLLASTTLLTSGSFIALTLFGSTLIPLAFGEKALFAIQYLPGILLAATCFSISRVFVSYYLAKKIFAFPVASFILAGIQILLISIFHESLQEIVYVMALIGVLNLGFMIVGHIGLRYVRRLEYFFADVLDLFASRQSKSSSVSGIRILIFNWRDTKHKWAGGAEVYAEELAKQFISKGHHVRLFCGSDGDSPRNQIVNKVSITRRGGTYSVYFWAMLYYIFQFRNKYDVIVDCENGIPFFTPLYSRKPVLLVIHHVHQEIFRDHLMFPLSWIASSLEGTIMPFLYRGKPVITVSESSKKAIIDLGITTEENVHIVHNGIELEKFGIGKKSSYPLFTYLGRLKAYKNIDVAIRAFSKINSIYPEARLYIVGFGEELVNLEKLVSELRLTHRVIFFGRVTETQKVQILQKSWAMVQPSSMEGWGITVIEANACGTTVIAANVNGLKDAVKTNETGLLVPLKNTMQLFSAMNSLIEDKKYRVSLSDEAYNWARNFSWKNSSDQFLEIISTTLRKNDSQITYGNLPYVEGVRS